MPGTVNEFIHARGQYTKTYFYAFYGWKLGLKTGIYYLRTKAAVDAVKFTVQKEEVKVEPEVQAVDPNDFRAMIEQGKKAQEEDDEDCIMCSG